jgi:hypothetical protein
VPIWPRTIRLGERWTITERVDGTPAVIVIKSAEPENKAVPGKTLAEGPDGMPVAVRAASRTRWLVPEDQARDGAGRDNFGFATWTAANAAELALLGPGEHHGQWFGTGIGRHGYGLTERRLALLDLTRWRPGLPDSVPNELSLIPVLAECEGNKLNATIARCLARLARDGSRLVPGAMAEGIIAFSTADHRFVIEEPISAD